jgi:Glycosyl hydrolases family 32 N-terminal domain
MPTRLASMRSAAAPRLAHTTSFRLFDPPRRGGVYAYAPSSITDGPNDYHFYCGNRGSSTTVDLIYLRDYFFDDVSWHLVGDRRVLGPTAGAWDSRHVCDPSVVEGDYTLNGVRYRYAMFYTGTQDPASDGTQNHIGMAVSNDLRRWVKRPQPLVTRQPHEIWGVGQPSATAVVDGEVMLFYTRSDPTATYAQHLDLADVNNPHVLAAEWPIATEGLQPYWNGNRVLHNADFAYDHIRDRFWIIRPAAFDGASPFWISSEMELAWMPGADVWNGAGEWTSFGIVGADATGRSKNDNGGVQRSPFGTLADPWNIRLNVTSFDSAPWPAALWEYRLHSLFVPVNE